MQPCQEHWDKLRKAIDDRGMGHLVAKDGKNLIEKFDEFKAVGAETLDNFDPLMAAFMGTVARLVKQSGNAAILENNPDGSERCMWCYVNEKCECGRPGKKCGEAWIDFAADGVQATVEQMKAEEFPAVIG